MYVYYCLNPRAVDVERPIPLSQGQGAMTPTHTAMVHNITSVYRLATSQEHANGIDWYPNAHRIVCEWAETFERSIANVACVVAALSPQMEWKRNLVIAADILAGNPPSIGGSIHRFVSIAERIRDDRATDTAPYFINGCKVRSFAANLAGSLSTVTVDTHGAQIAAGCPTANLRVDIWRRYEPVARAYVDAAKRAHVRPSELQAVTWLVWKRLYPQGRKNALRSRW